jgi:hypothetical protein
MSLSYFIYERSGFDLLKNFFSESDWDRYRSDNSPNYVSLQYNGLDEFKSEPELDFNYGSSGFEDDKESFFSSFFNVLTFGVFDDSNEQLEWEIFFNDFKENHSKRPKDFVYSYKKSSSPYESFIDPYDNDDLLDFGDFDGTELI